MDIFESQNNSMGRCLTFLSVAVLTGSVLTACISQHTSPPRETLPANASEPPVVDAKANVSSLEIYEPGVLQYQLDLVSVVEPVIGDSIHHADSTRTRAIVVVRLNPSSNKNSVIASIQIDSVSLQTSNDASIPGVNQVMSFRINKETGRVTSENSSQDQCANTNSTTSLFSGTEVLPTIGSSRNGVWTDSSQTQSCRGAIRVSLSRIANYSTLRQDSLDTQILRVTRVALTGEGSQWNQNVDVRGQGSATDTLVLVRSRLIQISGTSQLTIDFHSALRNQQYVQTVATKIELKR